jgi:hypothetical protein
MPNDDIMHLLARYLNGETSALESHALRLWAGQLPENTHYLREMEAIWNARPAESPVFDGEAAFNKLKSDIK